MFPFRFLPCPECGEAVDRAGVGHSCRADRPLGVEPDVGVDPNPSVELDAFEYDLHRYLDTPEGRLEAWVASRRVRRGL